MRQNKYLVPAAQNIPSVQGIIISVRFAEMN